MTTSTRRVLGAVVMLAGMPLITWSFCPPILALIDYFDLADTWDASCPTEFWSKVLFIGGIIVLVLGQRLYSGRKLHTGEKAE